MKGIRLVRKAVLMERVMVGGEFLRLSVRVRSIGRRMIVSVRKVEVVMISGISITFTWICTKMSGS